MDNFQRTEETELCLWSEKKRGGGILVASKLVYEKSGEGRQWEEASPGAQLRLQLPICLNLACGSEGPGKTQASTNVAQAKYWKKQSLDILYKL